MTHRPVVTWCLLAGLAWWGLAALRRAQHEHEARRLRSKPEPVQTWEGEGGSLVPPPAPAAVPSGPIA